MNRPSKLVVAASAAVLFTLFSCQLGEVAESPEAKGEVGASAAVKSTTQHKATPKMYLGNFSISLAVKDLAASRKFYEKLGFVAIGGNPAHNYQILQSGTNTIGLFQGMFEQNIMTFNPGWSHKCERLDDFVDVHQIQAHLKAKGIALTKETSGKAGVDSLVFEDPDGNAMLVDQHVDETKAADAAATPSAYKKPEKESTLNLGAFSISLAVKDLAKSRAFYETLGYKVIGGNPEHNYQILQSGMNTVGLFHGMFEDNMMTFNPGWTYDCKTLAKFTSVHEIQALLKKQGVELVSETKTESGKASIVLKDPDGNLILIDQHVD